MSVNYGLSARRGKETLDGSGHRFLAAGARIGPAAAYVDANPYSRAAERARIRRVNRAQRALTG